MGKCKVTTVSIIIPVYNSERYLDKCIRSLLNQTYKEIEILIIDDGSNYKCAKMCDEYEMQFENIITYHKSNGGTSDAKNFGISKANGDFILFVDSDDFVDSNYVETLVRPLIERKVDLTVCGYKIDYLKDQYSVSARPDFTKSYFDSNNIAEAIYDLDSKGLFNVAVCKIYSRKVLTEKNIKFDINLTTGEDLVFNCDYFKHINSVEIIDEMPYHYIRRDVTSLVNTYRSDLLSMVSKCNDKRKELYDFYNMNNGKFDLIYGKSYIDYLAACIPNMYRKDCNMSFREKIRILKSIIDDNKLRYYISICSDYSKFTYVFVTLCKTRNVYILWSIYSMLFCVRNNFGGVYRKIRKGIFTKQM